MSESKAKDAVATVGTKLTEDGGRDAIHVAVLSVVAGDTMYPGQHVGVVGDTAFLTGKRVGIVDPFLSDTVHKGERFWLCLYPRTTTSLRHVWEHPDFPAAETVAPRVDPDLVEASRVWIEDFAYGVDLTYDRLVNAAHGYLDHGSRIVGGSNLEGESVPDEFWAHFEKATGRRAPRDDRGSFFSCSC